MNVFSAYWIALLDYHVFNGIKEPEPGEIFPMFICTDVLGNILCKQLADIEKMFPFT